MNMPACFAPARSIPRPRKIRGVARVLFASVVLVTAALFAAPAADAACDHPYLPLRKGLTRHYKSLDGQVSNWNVKSVNGDQATVAIVMRDKGVPTKEVQMEVDCKGGAISLDFTRLGQDRAGSDIRFVRHFGSFLPPAEKLRVGYTWKTTETIEMTVPESTEPLMLDIKTRHSVAGTETVTVPAGTFEALKITAENEISTPIPEVRKDGNRRTATRPGMTTHTSSTYWLVDSIGLVKAEARAGIDRTKSASTGTRGGPGMSTTTTTELTNYSR
jgi:hypothetical protein